MADSDQEPFAANLVLENGTLLSIQLKKPKVSKDGEPGDAKTVLAFEFETELLERYFSVLSRLQRRDRPIKLGLAFVEQMELMARREPITPANGNGHGNGADIRVTKVVAITKRGKKSPEKEGARA